MNYRKTYDQLKKLEPRLRGTAFENLINKIFEDEDVLIKYRYRTKDTQQEIDGAVLIFNKIFLIEVKWEDSDTLAASKLYSFLGKINSKIEGTLGLFISYNELKPNFIDSVRNGIRQNCILIHGKSNIEDIIDKKVNLKDFLEYCFVQASIRNIIDVETSEFLALPYHETKKESVSLQKSEVNANNWFQIYNSLTGNDSLSKFSANLTTYYSDSIGLSKKIFDLYNALEFHDYTFEKLSKLVEKLISEEKEEFTKCAINKFKGQDWISYADEDFCILLQNYKLNIPKQERVDIIENVTTVFGYNNWEPENRATYIIDIFYQKLTKEEKDILLIKYLEIYCDKSRKDKFAQKQFAERLFREYSNKKQNYFSIIENELINDLKAIKINEEMLIDFGIQFDLKAEVFKTFSKKYKKVFDDNFNDIKSFFEESYNKF